MTTKHVTTASAGSLSKASTSALGAIRRLFYSRPRRPQSIGSASAGVRREIEQREMDIMAANFEAMPDHVLQRMAIPAYVDELHIKRRMRRSRH